jgi:hypothetical protein
MSPKSVTRERCEAVDDEAEVQCKRTKGHEGSHRHSNRGKSIAWSDATESEASSGAPTDVAAPSTVEVFATVRDEPLFNGFSNQGKDALSLLERRMVALSAERDTARGEALRLYCESWGMAVKVAEVREVLAETSFSADVLRMAQELAAQQRQRAEGAERERDALRERVQALEKELKDRKAVGVALCRSNDEMGDRLVAIRQRAGNREDLGSIVCDWLHQRTEVGGSGTSFADCGVRIARYLIGDGATAPSDDVESLADSLDREHRAHEQTRQALVEATREADGLRPVALAAGAVVSICDTTGMGQTEERLHQLGLAVDNLRAALNGTTLASPIRETIANLIMVASMRCGGQGRSFNAYEAAALVEAWFLGVPGQPKASPALESDSRYREWLRQWTDGRVAEREAELRSAAEPFLQFARDRLAWLTHEPIPALACRRFLHAFGVDLPEVDHA